MEFEFVKYSTVIRVLISTELKLTSTVIKCPQQFDEIDVG